MMEVGVENSPIMSDGCHGPSAPVGSNYNSAVININTQWQAKSQ